MEKPIGKYVTYREEYLRENAPEYYAQLVESGELNSHLESINKQAHEMKESIIERLKAESADYQQLTSTEGEFDFAKKSQLLTQFEVTADEIVCNELIYV